jgi:hypothetical protein
MFGLSACATGMPVVDAQDDFRRARLRHGVAWMTGGFGRRRGGRLPSLAGEAALTASRAELSVVTLDRIVGSVDPAPDFDDRFRPATNRVRRRWERVALAQRTGVGLPPITAVERADGLYVVDGRHRVSVAQARGHRSIDAWVRRAA